MSKKHLLQGALLIGGLALIAVAVVKMSPPPPPASTSAEPLPPASSAAPSAPSAPASQESPYDDEYLADKLYVTTQRDGYQSGQMVVKIPRLGLDKAVQDGQTDTEMAVGPGLYDYAQLPGDGKNYNVSLVAHRDIKGKELYYEDKLGPDDLFYLVYNDTVYTYAYEETYVVDPDDWAPIYSQGYPCITLTTCTPIGTTKQRLIVHGRQVETAPYTPDFVFAPTQPGVEKPMAWEPEAVSWDAVPGVSAAAPQSSSAVSAPPASQTSIGDSSTPGSSAPAVGGTRDSTPVVRTPSADGKVTAGNSAVSIDASNTSKGYVMVKYSGSNHKVKLQVTRSGGSTYTYDLRGGSYETFPLTAGSGSYTLNVFENVSGDQYAEAYGTTIEVTLASSLSPFLYPNQYVDFSANSTTVAKGAELAKGAKNDLEVVGRVFDWTIKNVTYDFDKANQASAGQISGYLPDADSILSSGKGICFDYAAVMATMLRSQNIPTKLVIGYAGNIYHAWVSIYLSEVGWVDNVFYFDGASWVRMDPTFASSGNSSPEIMAYIGNGNNYNPLLTY